MPQNCPGNSAVLSPTALTLLLGALLQYQRFLGWVHRGVRLGQVVPALPEEYPDQSQRTREDKGPLPTERLHSPNRQWRRDNGTEARHPT